MWISNERGRDRNETKRKIFKNEPCVMPTVRGDVWWGVNACMQSPTQSGQCTRMQLRFCVNHNNHGPPIAVGPGPKNGHNVSVIRNVNPS